MSQDEIVIDLKSDISEGDAAKRKLEEIDREVGDLRKSFEAGNVATDRYNDRLRELTREAGRAQKALETLKDAQVAAGKVKLEGADRASAKAQLGLASANIAQDAIQGGPASTINNFLGLAGNGKIRALVGEFVEAAGGAGALTAAIGATGVAVGGLFLAIDGGLKAQKLGWSDLGDVIDEMLGGSLTHASKQGESALGAVTDAIGGMVKSVADYTIGWSDAASAVRDHKDALEQAGKALVAYAAARKAIGNLKSDDQTENEKRGKLFGTAAANAAGPKGVEDLIDRVVTSRIGAGDGRKSIIQVPVLDEKGKPTGKFDNKEMTEREQQAEALTKMLAGAVERGEQASMQALIRALQGAGVDTKELEGAAKGVDAKEETKKATKDREKASDDAAKEGYDAIDQALDENDKRADELAKPLQERFNRHTASGGKVSTDMVETKLTSGGVDPAEAKRLAGATLEKLQASYAEEIRERAGKLGTNQAGAQRDILDEATRKDREAEEKQQTKDEQARRAQDQAFAEATAGTGAKERAEAAYKGYRLGGMTDEQARGRVAAEAAGEARAGGMTGDGVDAAAGRFVGHAADSINDAIVKQVLEPIKGPEQRDFASFASSLTLGDIPKQTLDVNKQMLDVLASIEQKTGGAARLAP